MTKHVHEFTSKKLKWFAVKLGACGVWQMLASASQGSSHISQREGTAWGRNILSKDVFRVSYLLASLAHDSSVGCPNPTNMFGKHQC